MTLGTPGVAGNDYTHFARAKCPWRWRPSGRYLCRRRPQRDVAQPARLHKQNQTPTTGNARVSKFDKNGKFLTPGGPWFGRRPVPEPALLGIDTHGNVFVGDRAATTASRSSTADGKFLVAWSQFGRPSGCFRRRQSNNLYVSDSESHELLRAMAITRASGAACASAAPETGKVVAFIPDDRTRIPRKSAPAMAKASCRQERHHYDAESARKGRGGLHAEVSKAGI